jgi:hypothetical protein
MRKHVSSIKSKAKPKGGTVSQRTNIIGVAFDCNIKTS